MNQVNTDLVEALPHARTNLAGFVGAALLVSPAGIVRPANDQGAALAAGLSDQAIREISAAAARAAASEGPRLERLNGPFPGESADAVFLPLTNRGGTLVLIAANPAETALRRALLESRQRYRELVDASADFVWETDRHGRFVFLSVAGALGHSTRDMLGRLAADFVVDASPLPYPVFQAREKVLATDVWLQRADGQISCQSITAVPIYDSDGMWCGTRGMARDVTQQREAERLEKQAILRDRLMSYLAETIRSEANPERSLPAALSGTGLAIGADGGLVLNGHPGSASYEVVPWGRKLPENDFAEARTALVEQGTVDMLRDGLQIVGYVCEDGSSGDGRVNGAVLFWRRPEGGGFSDGDRAILKEVAGQIGTAIARLRSYHEIVVLSNTDRLTGLLNRRAFFSDLERRLSRLIVGQGSGTLAYLDLNNLKVLNEAAGPIAGDRALLTVADMLRHCTRATDLIARIGGDEFLIWLEGVSAENAPARAENLLRHAERLSALSVVPERPLGVSIGIAVFSGAEPETVERLVARADGAMYRAKARLMSGYAIAPSARELEQGQFPLI